MSRLIESLYWEISARTEKLKAASTEVEQAERRISTSMRQAQGATVATGAAADRQAGQQQRLAQAMGASTQATSQLRGGLVALAVQSTQTSGAVGQVVQALLLFGAGSGAVIGIAAGISLIGSAWRGLTKDTRDAQAETDVLLKKYLALAEQDLPIPDQIKNIDDDLQRFREARRQFVLDAVGPVRASLAQAAGQGIPLSEFSDDQREKLRDFDKAIAAAEALRVSVGSLPRELTITADSATTAAEKLAKSTGQMRTELENLLAGFTATLVDDTQLALDRLRETFQKLPPEAQAELKALFDAAEREFREKIAGLTSITPEVVGIREEKQQLLSPASKIVLPSVERLTQEFKKLPGIIDEQIQALDREGRKLDDNRAKEAARITAARQGQLEQLRAIEQSARGALQLADAFGIIDDNARQSLESIVQVGVAVKDVLQTGTLSAGNFLSIAGGIASLIDTLFSDPEAAHRAEILKQNTEALQELKRSIGDLGVLSDVPGSSIVGVREAGQAALGGPRAAQGNLDRLLIERSLRAELARLDLTMADLREVAKGLGISFAKATPTAAELQQLLDQIANADITQFRNTFAGQLDALQDEVALFDITDPIEQLKRLRDVFKVFGDPAIAAKLSAFDLTTAEGRAAAEKFIQELAGRLNKPVGQGGLSVDELAGLSVDEFREFLKRFEGLIDQAAGGEGSTTSSPGIDRSITEVTGSRLAGILTSVSVHTERTADAAEAIAQLLASLTGGPPALPPSIIPIAPTAGSAAGGISSITINVGGITIQAAGDPYEVARAVESALSGITIDGLCEAMDRKMGEVVRRKAQFYGVLPG